MDGRVIAVSRSGIHGFSKASQDSIGLLAGMGVEGDAHAGAKVQHLSRVARDPEQPNVRQVHLVHGELYEELLGKGFTVQPGEIGENITTRDVDLLALPTGTRLVFLGDAIVELTGLRNPCTQLDRFQDGLMAQVVRRDDEGNVVRLAGVMGIVLVGGLVRAGDRIVVELPPRPHIPLAPV